MKHVTKIKDNIRISMHYIGGLGTGCIIFSNSIIASMLGVLLIISAITLLFYQDTEYLLINIDNGDEHD